MSAATSSVAEHLRLGDLGPKVFRTAAVIGVLGVVASIILGMMHEDGTRFFRSYLAAFMFVTTIGLGALFFVLIQHATRAGWATSLRRVAECTAANFVWLWILFIPIVIAVFGTHLYHWVHFDPQADPILAHKAPYLNTTFWVIRAVIFLGIWALLGRFYHGNSIAQDREGGASFTHTMQKWAPLGIVAFALTLTYSSIDWMKSLEPHWFSTMFGVYVFAASTCGFLSFQIIVFYFLQRNGKLLNEVTLEHYQDMGKLLFGFGVVFWAYIAFSQFMLIWYANIPEEIGWYHARTLGPWTGVSWLLLIGHFVLPFLLLVTKHTKHVKPVLAGIAAWLLVMHFVDIYWIVMPTVPAEELMAATSLTELREAASAGTLELGWSPHLIDLTTVIGVGGLFVAGIVRNLSRSALMPVGDPRLAEGLAFENM